MLRNCAGVTHVPDGDHSQCLAVQPVILCGGSGTRLWPLSRENHPKQMLSLLDSDSLLQATARRAQGIAGLEVAPPMVVCNEEHRFVVAEQLRLIDAPHQILLEPFGRNTAPALCICAQAAIKTGADPILLVMPSDHAILDAAEFARAVQRGAELASTGAIVTFGVEPHAPETAYGYIQLGENSGTLGARHIARFVEKPDLVTAQAYLSSGDYLWNSGILMLKASVWLCALQLCRPDILAACTLAYHHGSTDGEFVRVDRAAFDQCPSESIDYAVMEHLANGNANELQGGTLPDGLVIALTAGWSDVGAWEALWRLLPKDCAGNVARGDVMQQDCRNTLAFSQSRLIACVGMDDMIVVETADAVLVVHKDKAQSVKHIVARLLHEGRREGSSHRKVSRPWGSYDSVDSGLRFQVKRIVVKPGGTLSLQMHHHRAEHWIVVSGTAKVTRGNDSFLLSENESTFIPLGTTHRLENPGRMPLEMIEVQSGTYLGEDDIVRFEDIYGR